LLGAAAFTTTFAAFTGPFFAALAVALSLGTSLGTVAVIIAR
jgi:hypothetical protein